MSSNPSPLKPIGFLALMAVTPWLAGADPMVKITDPADGAEFPEGTAVVFTGFAVDPQFGDLSGSIEWSSSIDGNLGSGPVAVPDVILSAGLHTITASATNEAGYRGWDEITIAILPSCLDTVYAADFENGDDGGFVDGASTCTAGTFVLDEPNLVVHGMVTTQPAGAADGVSAWFTQVNTEAEDGDVDLGTCETLSPPIDVGVDQTIAVFVDYFHGQLATGDDPQDGFALELIDAETAAVLGVLAAIGDVTTEAAWTRAFSIVASTPATVQLRARATDGPAADDLIEAGIDNLVMCNIPVRRQVPID